jgi:hypothetical protein
MSRTIRKRYDNSFGLFRKPHTHNEITSITGIINDIKRGEYSNFPISGLNRMHRRKNIPDDYSDLRISSMYEIDF